MYSYLMQRVDSLGKTLMLGGTGGRRRRGRQRMRWLDGITDSMDIESEWTPGVGDGQGCLACCDSWSRKESDTTERLNWTELNRCHSGEFYNVRIINSSDTGNSWSTSVLYVWENSALSQNTILSSNQKQQNKRGGITVLFPSLCPYLFLNSSKLFIW